MKHGLDVMMYTHSFAGGGAERCVVHLANHWASQGRRIAICVNVDEGPLRSEVRDDVEVISLGQSKGFFAIGALTRVLKERQPDTMASTITMQNVVAVIANRLAGGTTRLLLTEQIFLFPPKPGRLDLRRRLTLGLVKVTYPFADAISAVSASAARDIDLRLSRPEGSTAVVYNPIWPPPTTPGVQPGDVHPWFAGPEPVVLAVGRLHAQKNHRSLIDALAIARRSRPIRAIVIGEGPLRQSLEVHAAACGVADAIDFPGFKRNVGDYLSAASLFVLSSVTEGMPLAMLEAMYMGVPVVSTNCPSGPDELLADGRYGTLVPVRDPEALAAAMLAALDKPHDRTTLRRRAEEFTIDAIARRYEALLFPQRAMAA